MRDRGKLLGLAPSGLQAPNLQRARERPCNAGDERFLTPVTFGAGYTVNPRSASRHPFRALFVAVLILLRRRATRRG